MAAMNQINQTMYNQFGGNKAIFMIGGQCVYDNTRNTITIRFKMCRKCNTIRIGYNAESDLYDIEFFQIRGTSVKTTKKLDGVYAENMAEIFRTETGLETRMPKIIGVA